jgi:hypothetical protein
MMARPIIIDANCFKTCYNEIIAGAKGLGSELLDLIFVDDFIGLDEGGIILQQWSACCCGEEDEFFKEWISNRIVEDKIRHHPTRANAHLKKKLRVELGFPAKDVIYILLGVGISAFMIVSEDIGFYEPKAKTWTSQKRTELITRMAGCVCEHMRKYFDVTICSLRQAVSNLEIRSS